MIKDYKKSVVIGLLCAMIALTCVILPHVVRTEESLTKLSQITEVLFKLGDLRDDKLIAQLLGSEHQLSMYHNKIDTYEIMTGMGFDDNTSNPMVSYRINFAGTDLLRFAPGDKDARPPVVAQITMDDAHPLACVKPEDFVKHLPPGMERDADMISVGLSGHRMISNRLLVIMAAGFKSPENCLIHASFYEIELPEDYVMPKYLVP